MSLVRLVYYSTMVSGWAALIGWGIFELLFSRSQASDALLDVMSMAQFLIMLGSLLDTVAKASDRPRSNYDWLRYLITRFEPGDGPQSQMAAFLRMIFGDYVLKNPTLKSSAISDAGITSQTIYEIERSQVTRSTYDRAIESVNSVNSEVLDLIRTAWGRK